MFRPALSVALFATVTFSAAAKWNPKLGMYSSHPVQIWEKIAGSPIPLPIRSPDGKLLITAHYSERGGDSDVKLSISGEANAVIDLGPGVGSELLWRPDSHVFLVTTSDQGANGAYRTILASLSPHGSIDSWDMTKLIYHAFGQPHRCGWPETPNVGGVGFLPNEDPLVAAEVIALSNCDSFGTFVLYEVDPHTHHIVKTYNQLEAKRLFYGKLGGELRQADDDCIRRPQSCYVSTNHPELHHSACRHKNSP